MLLDRADRPLVMTSGNATDEPIAIGNDEAMSRLRGIADLFLLHDREVVQRSDDSVVRRVGRGIYPIRRARGFVPAPVTLPRSFPDVVGLGGELKNTFCFVKGDAAYLSQHIGDLEQAPVRDFYEEAYRFFRRFLDARPRAACHDLHPAYFTTAFADRAGADRLFALQHHKAHIFSALADTGFAGKAVGVAFDGTGYGEDGAIWGGEFFAIDGMEVRRAGHLAYFPLPGGDAAVREPWRTALSLLRMTLGAAEADVAARELFPGMSPRTRSAGCSRRWRRRSTWRRPPARAGSSTPSPRSAGCARGRATRDRRRCAWRAPPRAPPPARIRSPSRKKAGNLR